MNNFATRRVLFLGDSMVAGVGDSAGGGWVARVVSACCEQGVPLTAYNLGIRGETSVQVAARWRAEAAPRTTPGADHRLVVSFGTNDTTLKEGTLRVPTASSCLALGTLLDEASALGFAPFVVGPAPVDDAEQNHRIEELTASFAQVCSENGTPFIHVVKPLLESSIWMSEVSAGDGAHPRAAGYQALAQLLIEEGLLDWMTH
jgi:acyl-CoA thioesterase I